MLILQPGLKCGDMFHFYKAQHGCSLCFHSTSSALLVSSSEQACRKQVKSGEVISMLCHMLSV